MTIRFISIVFLTMSLILGVVFLLHPPGDGRTSESVVTGQTSNAVELVSYDVPADRAEELVNVLSAVLRATHDGTPDRGRVERASPGTVVVVAPASIQSGIAELLDKLRDAPPPAATESLRLNYWLIWGSPSAETNAGSFPAIGEALVRLNTEHGPFTFQLAEHLVVSSAAGDRGHAMTDWLEVTQRVSTRDDQIVARIGVAARDRMPAPSSSRDGQHHGFHPRVDTVVSLPVGEATVVAQVRGRDGVEYENGATLFYIVHAERLTGEAN